MSPDMNTPIQPLLVCMSIQLDNSVWNNPDLKPTDFDPLQLVKIRRKESSNFNDCPATLPHVV